MLSELTAVVHVAKVWFKFSCESFLPSCLRPSPACLVSHFNKCGKVNHESGERRQWRVGRSKGGGERLGCLCWWKSHETRAEGGIPDPLPHTCVSKKERMWKRERRETGYHSFTNNVGILCQAFTATCYGVTCVKQCAYVVVVLSLWKPIPKSEDSVLWDASHITFSYKHISCSLSDWEIHISLFSSFFFFSK